jgi:hypothetical protein
MATEHEQAQFSEVIPEWIWIPRPPNVSDTEYAKLIETAKELVGWSQKKTKKA